MSIGLLDFRPGGATQLSCELSGGVEVHGKLGIGEMNWKSLLVGGPRLVPCESLHLLLLLSAKLFPCLFLVAGIFLTRESSGQNIIS